MSVRGVAGLGSRRLSSGVSEEFRVERLSGEKEGIVVFRMNRPKAMNAISKSLLASFWEAINEVKFDRRSRVIIIKSDVKGAFCAGFCHKESRKGDREKMAGMRRRDCPIIAFGDWKVYQTGEGGGGRLHAIFPVCFVDPISFVSVTFLASLFL